MEIRIDNLDGPEIAVLLEEHLDEMHTTTPPESVHALALESLRSPDITVWTIWDTGRLAGCGALRELDKTHGEIKSMRTARNYLRKGIATKILRHIIKTARERGYQRLSLETGSQDFFEPARKLYSRYGFQVCGPFAEYIEDPNSVFMTMIL